jgi:hypothetical protein
MYVADIAHALREELAKKPCRYYTKTGGWRGKRRRTTDVLIRSVQQFGFSWLSRLSYI